MPVAGNLARWLAISERSDVRVWPHSRPYFFESLRNTVEVINATYKPRVNKAVLFTWKANALRHSFISYRIAEIQDVNRVALEAGNSPRMIFQHYRELRTPADAQTWFALVPEHAQNIVPMKVAK